MFDCNNPCGRNPYDDNGELTDDAYATHSRTARLEDCPHYSDPYWNTARTIFGEKAKGLAYDYSDRLRQWDYKKADAAWEAAHKDGHAYRTAAFYEAYLTHYFGKPIHLAHIMAGCNVATGYAYLVFGYRPATPSPREAKTQDTNEDTRHD